MIIRVKFGKEGALRFIGHLDVLRTFQKIFRRADIPMAYSQGFSPHPIMSFALPLGLGLSSEGEYLDAEIVWPEEPGEGAPVPEPVPELVEGLVEGTGGGDLLSALRAATSPDLPIYAVRRLPEKAGNAMASVGRAAYRLEIRPEWTGELKEAAQALMARESILIQKETKSKTVEMDLRPCIHKLEVNQGDSCPPPEAGEGGPPPKAVVGGGDSPPHLILHLSAGSKANIKPELVWELLNAGHGERKPLSLRRLDLMLEDGTSLGAIGEEL